MTRINPVAPVYKTCDRKPNPNQNGEKRRLSKEELEEQDGIKAQHAAAAFVIQFLSELNNGWRAEETDVGGHYDRQGFDLLLIETKTQRVIPVDFSFASKDGAAVKYEREWFVIKEDGTWSFRKECAQLLFRQFIKVMSPNQHFHRA